ncbi:MAG: NAD(P)/FAD-dependent oxidoreductase [Erysipelotrichaceae bacterium]|nr:NAD(P)/FAD-dependent oxidoreductase [Erysipelotrichaceae bacterium]
MYDVIIIGAGIVGCSTAYYLSQYDLKVAVLEACNDVSMGTTRANSAIIHAGYDPEPGTLMAKHNVKGALMVRELCRRLDVPYKQCGVLVVGFDGRDMETIQTLYERGLANGVEFLKILNREETHDLEPQLSADVRGALLAPTSAIVSPWELALALMEVAVENGVELKLNNKVEAISKSDEVFTVRTSEGEYQGRYVVNAAGIYSDVIHEMIGQKEFTITRTKGEYYLLDKSEGSRVSHTIFQCPSKVGKGVLVSPTVHGNLIVGPNAEDSDNTDTTYEGLQFVRKTAVRSVPFISFGDNIRNFAGIRAKNDRGDFIVEESRSVPGLYNIAGIMSPGLSSAPSLALEAVDWLKGKMELHKKAEYKETRKKVRFSQLNAEEKNELIKKDPRYGRIICRCETVTEGEIVEAIHGIIPAVSIDAVKRRCNAGMGRCQGGFCGGKVAEILVRERGISPLDVLQNQRGTNILVRELKVK